MDRFFVHIRGKFATFILREPVPHVSDTYVLIEDKFKSQLLQNTRAHAMGGKLPGCSPAPNVEILKNTDFVGMMMLNVLRD
jgi:hypothetical protein